MTGLLLLLAAGCTDPAALQRDHQELTRLLTRAQGAQACAPEALARAEAGAAFVALEMRQGDAYMARQELDAALAAAREAARAAPGCASRDRDGDGIPDVRDACPDDAEDRDGVGDDDGCPDEDIAMVDEPPADRDGDQVLDEDDACPRQAEDIDGFEDDDGCPDLDNDGDGIADAVDACPDEPGPDRGCPDRDLDLDGIPASADRCPDRAETSNGWLDDDGCPDRAPEHLRLEGELIVTDPPIRFRGRTAELLPEAAPVLRELAEVLQQVPDWRLRIEGHTDSQGEEADNLRLSQQRAEAVRAELVRLGVDGDRLEAVGYGETRPIDTNRTAEGRANNNRVELHLVTAEGP